MKQHRYQFYYLRRYQTRTLLTNLLQGLDRNDLDQYTREIGNYLYQFQIAQPINISPYKIRLWTVIKTFKQIQKFISAQSQQGIFNFSKRIIHQDDFKDNEYKLQRIRLNPNQPIPQYIVKFFQIYNPHIKKLTSFRMERKVRGLTWAKRCSNFFCGIQWQTKRIFITSQGLLQMQDDDGEVTDFLKFDLYFTIKSGTNVSGEEFGIALFSAQRKVVLRTLNIKDFVDFLFYITKALQQYKTGTFYLGSCRRTINNKIDFLVDAQRYFCEVAIQIKKAKKIIFICGWWVSPYLYLVRPVKDNENKDLNIQYRLDQLLKSAAQRGVKIYVVVFFSPSVIPNDSDHTKKVLSQLHPNITVERHPHQFLPKLWSHHQKAVIVDQEVALLGGLDLCYGRYDDSDHPVKQNNPAFYPGIDYNNVRIKDFIQVKNYTTDLQLRNLPRMPWHDVAYKVEGKFVADVSNHFIQYWNFSILEKRITPIVAKTQKNLSQSKQNLQQTTHDLKQKQPNQDFQKKLIFAIMRLAIQKNDKINKKQKQAMIQHIKNKNKREKQSKQIRKWRLNNKFQLNNGPGQNCLVLSIKSLYLLRNINEGRKRQIEQNYHDQLQLLRSSSEWSIGLQQGVIERSIQNAYLSVIRNAKHFIYIQNQFFISATGQPKSYVQNQIANSLFERIKKAVQKKQRFRVVVFMPLVPGMQGPLDQSCPTSLKLTMFWQYNTICRSEKALIPRIEALGVKAQDYIEFYSLRNHGILEGQPVTQLIYIHTKLMIADDDIVICGSANINDRSQQGDRDSQLAVIFTSGQKTYKRTDGKYTQVNSKAYKLRLKLFQQHFQLLQNEVEDPLNIRSIQKQKQRAKTNTQKYRKIFGCLPDDKVKKLSDSLTFQKTPAESLKYYEQQSNQIKGHVVQFPTKFLIEQELFSFNLDLVQDIFT